MDSCGWELTCEDAWLTSEGNLDGFLEHVWLSRLLGVFGERRRKRYTVPLSEKESAKQWFRIWSGFCLCWSAGQVTEITQKMIDPEFLPTATNVDRGVPNQEFVLQQMYTALMALTRCEADDNAANPWKKPLEAWRKLQNRWDPETGGRKRDLLRTIISPAKCSLLELRARIERWESYVSRYEKKMRDTIDDELKLSLVWRHWGFRNWRNS